MTRKNAGRIGLVLLAICVVAWAFETTGARAATARWSLPTTYTDNTPISADNQAKITVEIFRGKSASGPWTSIDNTTAGATTATFADPAEGETLWYTLASWLNGKSSEKGAAKSKTVPLRVPNPPGEDWTLE